MSSEIEVGEESLDTRQKFCFAEYGELELARRNFLVYYSSRFFAPSSSK